MNEDSGIVERMSESSEVDVGILDQPPIKAFFLMAYIIVFVFCVFGK